MAIYFEQLNSIKDDLHLYKFWVFENEQEYANGYLKHIDFMLNRISKEYSKEEYEDISNKVMQVLHNNKTIREVFNDERHIF